MKAAIDFWKQYETEVPHLAFLGDMLELGLESESYHIEIGKSLPMKENIVTIGHYSQKMNALTHFENIERLLEQFDFQTIPDACIILLKGSNSIRLNKLMEKL
jgi:UDP-N-acetylmuramyl pentapeptide synthase